MTRGDRVYAVASTHDGLWLAVGGRDSMTAMYQTAESDTDPKMRLDWEVKGDDFVYAIALSPNRDYCVYGGTAKKVGRPSPKHNQTQPNITKHNQT